MSELAPGAKFYPKVSFLERNRLISGLADVVVIPEAAERSGSLNTAAHALEQGREIFAVPGDITRPLSMGCNRLIRQGATPYLGLEDVLDLLLPVRKKRKTAQMEFLFGDDDVETAILRLIVAGTQDGEQMMEQIEANPAEFSRALTMLEIKGRIIPLGANKWAIK